MAFEFAIPNLKEHLQLRRGRSLVGWNRLEGRPRSKDITGALRAEVRDPLWMLTRQWQMGEFKGDDAGSPITASPIISHAPLERYQPEGGPPEAYDPSEPPEMRVEARPLSFERGNLPVSLDIRLLMGRHWLKMIAGIGEFAELYRKQYPVLKPDPDRHSHNVICAHADVWQSFAAASGRLMDGYLLYAHLTGGPGRAAADEVGISGPAKTAVNEAGKAFLAWFQRQFHQPDEADQHSWAPERLEYQFSVSAPSSAGEKVFVADEYFHGHLDWYNLDIDSAAASLGAKGKPILESNALVPTPIRFPGMPDTRWWAFEDGRTNLGQVDVTTADIGRMLFLEFALIYANDWYLMPLTLPADSYASVRGIAVTNVFGERFWVAPAGEGIDGDWRRWTMFTVAKKGGGREIADTGLYMHAVVPKIQEGKALEEVLFTRDEMANMVWAIEHGAPLADGRTRPGRETARERRAFFEKAVRNGAALLNPPAPLGPVRYEVMSTVEEHWIPFVAARKTASSRDILLQRASMLRVIDGDPNPPRRVLPQSVTLREGLDRDPRQSYFIEEEEVPRSGVRVARAFQRTRWHFGKTCTWVGMRKQTGRGEGASGLAFDMLAHQKVEPES
jgi:hypothetical protein